MGPRWKGKGAETKALADPLSKIVSLLQSSLLKSNARASLCGCSVLLAVETEQTELLTRACFESDVGRLKVRSDFHSTIRLCGSVAKTLLVLNVDKNNSPSCLDGYSIEECTISRWSAEQSRNE